MTQPLSRRDAIAAAIYAHEVRHIPYGSKHEPWMRRAIEEADMLIAELDRTEPKPEANELVGAFGAWAIFGRGGQLLDVSCAQPIEGPRGSVLVNGRVVYEGARAILVRLVPVEE